MYNYYNYSKKLIEFSKLMTLSNQLAYSASTVVVYVHSWSCESQLSFLIK